MQESLRILIGVFVLILGIPVGNWLSSATKEELGQGQKWFKRIVIISLMGVLVGLILRNDVLLFSFAFIAIVTSRSLKRRG
jgi:uncharacterized protein HemY